MTKAFGNGGAGWKLKKNDNIGLGLAKTREKQLC